MAERLQLCYLRCTVKRQNITIGTRNKDFISVSYSVQFNARTLRTDQERKTSSLLVIVYSLTLEHQEKTKADKYFICHS